MGVDCRNWDEEAYRNSILEERESQCQTVFRTAFAPSPNPNPDLIVAASSDGSVASFSISSFLSSLPQGFGNDRGQNLSTARPQCCLQGHDGPAYDVKFCGNGEDSLLVSCGDDGRIRGWRWKEISHTEGHVLLQGNKNVNCVKGGDLKPVLDLVNPQHNGPWGSLSPIPENNAIAVDNQGESIFAAAGDSCAYCWDVIITGSEDGTARIWDCRSGKCIQVIDLKKDKKLKELFPYVSCIALDASESWLACGNGRTLSVWNLPARECISRISARAAIQDVVFDGNQVLAVGAEPLLSRYDMNGFTLSQIQCAPQSVFSISLHPAGVTAVAGYGGLVDVISEYGSHLCSFRC